MNASVPPSSQPSPLKGEGAEALPPPASVRLTTLSPHPCPYLPDRQSTLRGFVTTGINPLLYHAFMDAGFRRSGTFFYQPVCQGCRECLPIRVPTATFAPSKSQRRV